MHTRNWITLTLCMAALAGPGAGSAQANEGHADTGDDRTAQAAATAAQEDPQGPDDFKVVHEMPKVLKQVPPKYPRAARKRGEQGTVFVQALVRKDGTPARVAVASGKGVSPELDKAAVAAVSQWTFVPARLNGEPTAVYIVIPVKFRLK